MRVSDRRALRLRAWPGLREALAGNAQPWPYEGDEEFAYKYVEFGRRQQRSKTLLILFTADGTVGDIRFGSDTAPARPAGNYLPAPVIVTPHK